MRLHAAVGAAMSGRADVDADDLAYQLLAGGDLVDPMSCRISHPRGCGPGHDPAGLRPRPRAARPGPAAADPPAGRCRAGRAGACVADAAGTAIATRLGFAAPDAEAALERALDLALRVEPGPDVFAAVYRRYLWLLMAGDFGAVQRLADDLLYHAAAADSAETRDRFGLLGRLALGSVLWCLGEAEPAVAELLHALRLAEDAGVGLSVEAFGDPGVRIRMFLCHALAAAGPESEALTVADEMVRQAHRSGPADESDALATRGMMFAALGEPERAHADGIEGRRLGRLAGANLLEHFAALNESWGAAIPGGSAGSERSRWPGPQLMATERPGPECTTRSSIRCSPKRRRPPAIRTGRRRPPTSAWTPCLGPAAGCGVTGCWEVLTDDDAAGLRLA